jgi:hypothetical protein
MMHKKNVSCCFHSRVAVRAGPVGAVWRLMKAMTATETVMATEQG